MLPRCRDGAVQRYFSHKGAGMSPRKLCPIIPPGGSLAGANRGPVGGSRRGRREKEAKMKSERRQFAKPHRPKAKPRAVTHPDCHTQS